MPETTQSIEVDVSPAKLFKIIVDFEKYPEFVTGISAVKTLKESEKNPQVQFDIRIIKKISYLLDFAIVKNKTVEWWLAKKGFFKVNNGKWILTPLDKGKRTKASYVVELEMGLVPSSILKTLNEVNMPKMLGEFKKRAEEG